MAASILLYCHGRANKMAPWVEVLATCLDHLNLFHKMEEGGDKGEIPKVMDICTIMCFHRRM